MEVSKIYEIAELTELDSMDRREEEQEIDNSISQPLVYGNSKNNNLSLLSDISTILSTILHGNQSDKPLTISTSLNQARNHYSNALHNFVEAGTEVENKLVNVVIAELTERTNDRPLNQTNRDDYIATHLKVHYGYNPLVNKLGLQRFCQDLSKKSKLHNLEQTQEEHHKKNKVGREEGVKNKVANLWNTISSGYKMQVLVYNKALQDPATREYIERKRLNSTNSIEELSDEIRLVNQNKQSYEHILNIVDRENTIVQELLVEKWKKKNGVNPADVTGQFFRNEYKIRM